MTGRFRVTVWDPSLIISQIIALQSSLYFSFGALLILGSILTGTECTLTNIFQYRALNFSDRHGVLTIVCYTLTALCGAVALWKIVRRTKQCLDFSVTAYMIHILICWMYNSSLPNTLSWCILTVVAAAIMCVTGEFLCLKTELEDIPLLGARVDL